jgi:hypothetical protein
MKTTLSIIMLLMAAAPGAAQDVLQFSADIAGQSGINVVALEPANGGAVVKGAPYSAEAITETIQVLADGNRIERRTSAAIARNSEGAVRREQHALAVGALVPDNADSLVTITNPASGEHITLDYQRKIAFRMKAGWFAIEGPGAKGGSIGFGATVLGSRTGPVVVGGQPALESGPRGMPLPPPPAEPFDEPVSVDRVVSTMSPGVLPGSEYKTEDLEPRTIEGLAAQGTRTTVTIPAGAIGNALPIEIVTERWFSPDLKIVLQTRRADPRFGETVYRVTNVSRDEPSPDLFKVPTGFRIENMKP